MGRIMFLTFLDLRFLLSPLINLILYYNLPSSQQEGLLLYWDNSFLNFPRSTLIIVTIIIFVLPISFMICCTSITIPFALTIENRLSMQFGKFSLLWTASFIASFILSPTVFFYVVFPVTILIYPFYQLILNMLRPFFGWLLHTLQRFPGVVVICVLDGTQPPEQPSQFESPDIEINSAHDQPNSEPEL